MDPTDPGGRPPLPERPAPPQPAWPPPPAAPSPGWSQPPGSVPPTGPPFLGQPPPSSGRAGWGDPAGPPGWGPPAPPPRHGRRVGWILAAVAALLAVALVATVLVLRPGVQVGSPPQALRQRPAIKLPPDPRAEVPRLLAKRAKALLGGDRAGFLATVDRRRKRYYQSQATLFARMRTVPFSTFSYRVTDPRDHAGPTVDRRYADPVYLPQVEARYRFRGQDASPVLTRYFYTFVLTRSGWRIANQGEAGPRGRGDVEIWDAGPVKTLRSARTLIVHHPGDEELAVRLLRVAERAYGQVGAAWTGRWERKAVILVPRDQDEAERLVGARDLSRVAAVASSSVESGAAERVLGNRIVVNSTNVVRYNDLNLQILITHELTHVATRTLGDGVPLLLVEGFADWAALEPIGFPFRDTRPVLAKWVRQGRFDGALPSDHEFRGRDASVAYDEGSAFCLWVAETYGVRKLRALYSEFAGSRPPTTTELDRGFRHVLGISRRTAEGRWAAWVRDRL
ncbi:MAG TPA: hypothetical protein VGS14_09260 [Actinomycetes bacterium]|nr:hypothetical protein [Actinomycetes bacterium]